MAGMSLLDLLNSAQKPAELTKQEFGRIMRDPESTEEDINKALKMLQEADGYENLPD